MTVYIFDASSLLVFQNYFPDTFQSFWEALDDLVDRDRVFSVKECLNELDTRINRPHLTNWVQRVKVIFRPPNNEETLFVSEILKNNRFRDLVKKAAILEDKPVADPWIIASGKIHKACVVTEESYKPHAARIPNACEFYKVDCTNVEGFLKREKWRF